jgi:carboxypeptidase Taq
MTSDADAAASTDETYDRLLERVRRLTHVESARGVLSWDQQVTMPEGGTPARSKQLSALSTVHHDLLTDPELGDLLEELGHANLDGERAAVVREVRRDHDRATAVPRDLVEKLSEASTEALGAWEEAKAEDDFDAFAPHLERLVDLNREYARHVDPDRDPYAVLFEEYEPCLSMERVEAVLSDLRETLVPLVARVRESDADLTTDAFVGGGHSYDEATQEALSR